jgi:type IV pilus assembly protein PilC
MSKRMKYVGVREDGRKVQSEIDAENIKDAKKLLKRQGIRVVKITEPSSLDMDLGDIFVQAGLVKPFGQAELMRFTRQLSILINAGVPIMECLEILYKQEKNKAFQSIIKKVATQVESGKTLYEALSYSGQFNKLYCSLIKAGESAGILDTILNKISDFLEKNERLKKKVKGALTYPTIVVFVGIVVIFALMTFVVPQFVGMLKETGQELPWVTKTVIDVSQFFQDYTFHLIIFIGLGSFFFFKTIKSKNGKPGWDRFAMKSPLFGELIIKSNLASFTRTLATMLSAGVPIIDSLEICIDTIDNTKIAKDLTGVRKAVTEGKSLTEPLRRIPYFPPIVTQMMKVGESTGKTDEMMLRVSNVFDEEVEDAIDNMTKLIEPIILVVLGGIICFVLVAMYLPMFMSAGGADSG